MQMIDRQIRVSIVICTHNRSTDVVQCLNALIARTTGLDVELIVVDSGSNEEHSRHMQQYLREHSSVKYLRLDVPGTSLARNAGLRLARGEWIWWLDDDAIPTADWPERLADTIRNSDGKTAVIGGKVIPQFEDGADTEGLTKRWRLLLTCIDQDKPGYVSEGCNIACANMLMKRSVALEVGGFSEKLGRSANQFLTGEESLLIEMIHDRGFKCAYQPMLSVLHKVSSKRLTREWVSERAYWEGHVRFRILKLSNRKMPWSLNPLKLLISIYVLQLLSMLKPSDADLAIRMNLAKGTLDAIGASRASL